jgi:hypothetical protein
VIPAFEMVMRARNNVYHLECFACQQCNHRSELTSFLYKENKPVSFAEFTDLFPCLQAVFALILARLFYVIEDQIFAIAGRE